MRTPYETVNRLCSACQIYFCTAERYNTLHRRIIHLAIGLVFNCKNSENKNFFVKKKSFLKKIIIELKRELINFLQIFLERIYNFISWAKIKIWFSIKCIFIVLKLDLQTHRKKENNGKICSSCYAGYLIKTKYLRNSFSLLCLSRYRRLCLTSFRLEFVLFCVCAFLSK